MREELLAAMLRPILIRAIRGAASDPRRAIRDLLDMARPFLDKAAAARLETAWASLPLSESDCAAIRRLARAADTDLLADLCTAAACGALRCWQSRQRGVFPRWRAAFDLSTPIPVLLRLLNAERRGGAFLFFLYGAPPDGLPRLLEQMNRCVCVLFLRRPPGPQEIRRFAACRNAVFFVHCPTPQALERTRPLTESRCLWGAYAAVGPRVLPLWAQMVSAETPLACAEPEQESDGGALYRAVQSFRRAPGAPLLLASPREDLRRLDALATPF